MIFTIVLFLVSINSVVQGEVGEKTYNDSICEKYQLKDADVIPEGVIPKVYTSIEEMEKDLNYLNKSMTKGLIEDPEYNDMQVLSNNNGWQSKSEHWGGGLYINIGINYTYGYRYEYGQYWSYFISCNSVSSWISGSTAPYVYTQVGSTHNIYNSGYALDASAYGVLDYYIQTPWGAIKYWSKNTTISKTFYP